MTTEVVVVVYQKGRGGDDDDGTPPRIHHHQIYLLETLRQKIQDGLHRIMKKNFKIED